MTSMVSDVGDQVSAQLADTKVLPHVMAVDMTPIKALSMWKSGMTYSHVTIVLTHTMHHSEMRLSLSTPRQIVVITLFADWVKADS